MATTNPNASSTNGKTPVQTATVDPIFSMQRIYLKEVSLEQPNSPSIFLETDQPKLEVQLSLKTEAVIEGLYEVCITATVQETVKDKTVFLLETTQAGIFEIRNIPVDQMGPLLGIGCPQILYPYLRSNVADVISRAGFPPFHLAEMNFQAMYEQQQKDMQTSLQQTPSANDA